MSLVVEDGTGLATAESYLSVADCDTYHVNANNSTWTGAAAVKEAALRAATKYLDGHYRDRWIGLRQSQTQALEWPRYEAYDTQGFGFDAVPADLKNATAELALKALGGALQADADRGGAVISETVGPISTTYAPGATALKSYPLVDDMLGRLVKRRRGGIQVVRV